MGIGVSFMKFIVMLCIFIHILPHKVTFFARIMLLVLMVKLNVFLHKGVSVGLVRTPCADACQVFQFEVWRKVLKILHTVSAVTVASNHVLLLYVFLETGLIACLVITRLTLPERLLLVDRLYMTDKMILSGHCDITLVTFVHFGRL